jgi:hypothetical protein
VIRESVDTGRLRFITSIASTARNLGVPNVTDVPSTVICSGPRTPNPILIERIGAIVTRGRRDLV